MIKKIEQYQNRINLLFSFVVMVAILLGENGMKTEAAQVAIEDERNELFNDGSALRDRLIRELERAQLIRVTAKEALLRNRIIHSEETLHQLRKEFVAYDGRVSNLIQTLATASNVRTPQGVEEPINLNRQFQFAVYRVYSQ